MAEQTFALSAFLQASTTLRTIGREATSMEEVAGAIVEHLREQFVDKATGRSAFPLARLYVTSRSDQLEPELQDFARSAAPDAFDGRNVVCLTLLGTAGEEPAWNDRHCSSGHKAIPLPSVETLRRSPMIAQLVSQLGIDAEHIVEPDPELFRDIEERTYNVFYVPEARDCPYVPAQNSFVIPYGIRSVVGFGGVLPGGTLFATVLFSTVPIPASALDAFAAVALSTKVALLDHVGGPMLAGLPGVEHVAHDAVLAASKITTLSQLLDARATVVEHEALRLEREASWAEERAAELAASREALAVSEARKTAILEGALDCIIGMDSHGHITDFNRSAEVTFGYDRHEVTGQTLADVLIPSTMRERHRLGLDNFLITGEGPVIGRRIEVSALRRDGSELPVELTVTRVAGTDPPQFSGSLRDISDRRRAEANLAASRERLAHIARTLQTSLLPPSLPVFDGIELAAAFRAFGDGYEVGGDFYDAFELGAEKWALVLGDVCGKGSSAAVITALARYTLRAAAMRDNDPAAVLGTLNDAIHRQHPDSFCTAAYATLDPTSGRVDLGLGGHPHPFLRTAKGEIRRVGHANLLLGPFGNWRGTTDSLVLAPGDTLVLFSDGLTEARNGHDLYGEDRLVDQLRQTVRLGAEETVNLIETSVLDFAGVLNDDLAVLAVQRRRASSGTLSGHRSTARG